MYKNAKKVPFFHTCTTSQVFEIIKSDLSKYLNNILSNYKKKVGAKILRNTKVLKVLLTGGTTPISKIIAKFLTMNLLTLCSRNISNESSFDAD